jgi:ABC-type uncharacterized transport system fused permease/ATPase subunit
MFNYLGRDWFNALAEKNVDAFQSQLVKYMGGFVLGIPVFVFKGYYQASAWAGLCWASRCSCSKATTRQVHERARAGHPGVRVQRLQPPGRGTAAGCGLQPWLHGPSLAPAVGAAPCLKHSSAPPPQQAHANTPDRPTARPTVQAHANTPARPCAPQSKLSLEWREWMTERLLQQYFSDRSFYQLQSAGLVDNPDQRIASDVRCAGERGREQWWHSMRTGCWGGAAVVAQHAHPGAGEGQQCRQAPA